MRVKRTKQLRGSEQLMPAGAWSLAYSPEKQKAGL